MPRSLIVVVNESILDDGLDPLLKNKNANGHARPRLAFVNGELLLWEQNGATVRPGNADLLLEFLPSPSDSVAVFCCLDRADTRKLCETPWKLTAAHDLSFAPVEFHEWAPHVLELSRADNELANRRIAFRPADRANQNLYIDPIHFDELDENSIARILGHDFGERAICLPPRPLELRGRLDGGQPSHDFLQHHGLIQLRQKVYEHLCLSESSPALTTLLKLSTDPIVSDFEREGGYVEMMNAQDLTTRSIGLRLYPEPQATGIVVRYRANFLAQLFDKQSDEEVFREILRALARRLPTQRADITSSETDLARPAMAGIETILRHTQDWTDLREEWRIASTHPDRDEDDIEIVAERICTQRNELHEVWQERCPVSYDFYRKCVGVEPGIPPWEYLLSALGASDHPAMTFCMVLAWPKLKPYFEQPMEGDNASALGHFSFPAGRSAALSDCFEAFFELLLRPPNRESIERFAVNSGILTPERLLIDEEKQIVVVAGSHYKRIKHLLGLALPLEWLILPGCFLESDDISIDYLDERGDFELGLLV